MYNRQRTSGIVLLIALLVPPAVRAADSRPLPSDPRIVTGRLDNGVKWMFRKHANPPGRLSLYMHVRTGSLNETDEQRGLSHFLEHMVFNGTEHFAPGALIPYFESIGMKFGGDVNASTSFERTSYSLQLPNVQPEQIDKALMVLSDYVFRATLTEKEIDDERAVILEEARTRKSVSQRVRDRLWPELFEGSRFASRLPIGDEKVVGTAPRQMFLDFYRTWYRPEYVTILMVGDTDPEPLVPMIRKWFGDYRPSLPEGKRMGPEFKPFKAERAIVITDAELTTCSIQMCNILPGRGPSVTVADYRTEMVEDIAGRMLMRRFDDRVKKGQAAYRGAQADIESFYNDALMVTAAASGEPADWNRMLEQLIIELRTACEQGFTEHEFDLVRKEVLAALERGVRTEATTSAKTLIQGMHTGVNNREPILSAQQHLDLVKELFPTVSAGEVAAVFKKYFDRRTYAYVILMPEKAGKDIPSRDGVLAAARAAWARRIEAATRTESTAQLPAPATTGRAIDLQVEKDFGVTHGWLENGIRVHHRFMDYKKDSVMVSINLAGGGIEETAKNLGVTSVASLAVAEPATSRLSSSDIRDLGAGRNVRVGGGGADDETFAFRIAGSPRDLEYGFQLVYALMTDGRIEETAFKNWRIATLRALERSEKDVGAQAGDALADLTSGGDPRRRTIRRAEVERLGIQEGQAWFDRLCREAPIEVAVVGDIQWDQVRPLLERYLGTLPTRPRSAAHLDKLRSLARGDGPFTRTVEVETQTPVGVAYAGFVGCEGSNINDRRALQVAESILTTRAIKRIREELGLVYSISASNTAAWIYRDSGMFRAGSKCKPENADRVAEEVHRLFREFAESGCTDTELQNARKQLINGLDEAIREPSYWLNLLEHLDLHRRSLEEARTQKKHYETVPAEEIQKAFKRYYVPARIFTVTAVPAKAAAGTAK